MCKDISEIAKVVNERSFLNNIVIGSLELVIIHRLLLELFCQNDDSQHFRDCPNKNDVRLHIIDTISFQVKISNDFNKYILNMF